MSRSFEAPETIPYRCPACGTPLGTESPPAAEAPCAHCGKPLWFVHKELNPLTIIHFAAGRILKDAEFQTLREFLFSRSPSPRVILNLDNCQYFSDTTLAGFILLYKKLAAAQGQLKICGLRSPMLDVFKLARLDQLFDIYDDERSALAGFEKPAGK
jgi:anti-sigma B factor antagonist